MRLKPDVPLTHAPVPAVYHAPSRRKRTIRDGPSGTLDQCIGRLAPGCEIFLLTNGQFSLIDLLVHLLNEIGPASLDLATWTAADGDLRRAHAMLLDNRISTMRMIVDPSFRVRKPGFCATLVDLFGPSAIRTIPLHAKFAVLRNEHWAIAVRTSMNLNPNKRIESVEISDDPALADFLGGIIDRVFARSADANFASQSRGQLARHPSAADNTVLTFSDDSSLLF